MGMRECGMCKEYTHTRIRTQTEPARAIMLGPGGARCYVDVHLMVNGMVVADGVIWLRFK